VPFPSSLSTQIFPPNSSKKKKEKLEFSEYEQVKEKIMHLRDRLEEFATTKQVLK